MSQKTPAPKVRLAIRSFSDSEENTENIPCALCGTKISGIPGVAFCLLVTGSYVCRDCGTEHEPALAATLYLMVTSYFYSNALKYSFDGDDEAARERLKSLTFSTSPFNRHLADKSASTKKQDASITTQK